MTEIVAEAIRLYKDIGDNTPNLREKTAAGAFLAHFYNGVENILKRICYLMKDWQKKYRLSAVSGIYFSTVTVFN